MMILKSFAWGVAGLDTDISTLTTAILPFIIIVILMALITGCSLRRYETW